MQKTIEKIALNIGIDAIGYTTPAEITANTTHYYPNDTRTFPLTFMPECKTIIAAALSYNYQWNKLPEKSRGYIARYTTANFYKLLKQKLKELGDILYTLYAPGVPKREFYKVSVNDVLNDKLIGYTAGIGSFTANSLLSINNLGSYFVIGSLLIAPEVPFKKNELHPQEICAQCGACSKICPTHALTKERKIDKTRCIQYLSGIEQWEETVIEEIASKHWKHRFFGCTACIDICPLNKNNPLKTTPGAALPGYIGTHFIPDALECSKKGTLQAHFIHNQLGARWINETALLRNALLFLYAENRFGEIEKIIINMSSNGYTDEEVTFIKEFVKKLPKL